MRVGDVRCVESVPVWWRREGIGEEKEGDSGGANSVCEAGHGGTRIPGRVSTDLGRFEEPLAQGWLTHICCHRDPARNLEQGPEGPETPIQVVLRWVQVGEEGSERGRD